MNSSTDDPTKPAAGADPERTVRLPQNEPAGSADETLPGGQAMRPADPLATLPLNPATAEPSPIVLPTSAERLPPASGGTGGTPRHPALPPAQPTGTTRRHPALPPEQTRRTPPRSPQIRDSRPAGYPPPAAAAPPRRAAPRKQRTAGGCLLRLFLAGVLAVVVVFALGLLAVAGAYAYLTRDLPSIDDLQARAQQVETAYILDRDGQLLYELNDPEAGRRTTVPLERISPWVITATVDTEDKTFWQNRGFDPIGIVRAIKAGIEAGESAGGASTITQQLVRALVFTPQEAAQRTWQRKVREIILAEEISRRYSKEDILQLYLNQIPYGNLAYGIQAAAQTYYGVDAKDLTLAQASLLVGLPQAPSVYDPYSNYDATLVRQKQVLNLIVRQGHITAAQAEDAAAWAADNPPRPPRATFDAPHFVNYVRSELERRYDPSVLRNGLRVTTTLDREMQQLAENAVREQIAALSANPDLHVTNGALVALDPRTGEVLAMVGSVDYNNDAIGGQVNVALRCRQPGSSIKPLTYVTAMAGFVSNNERVYWTPSTVIWDLRTEFPDQPGQPYVPQNYDLRFHGPMTMRTALANSYNIPAVKALQFIGVDALLATAEKMGVQSLAHPQGLPDPNDPSKKLSGTGCPDYPYDTAPAYGLALTLGGGETTLLEMTGAYAVFANGGKRVPPTVLLKVTDNSGNVLLDYEQDLPAGDQVITPGQAYLITSILSDAEARAPMFGINSILNLDRPAAAKTGTTNDYRDNWTIGYTPDLVTGVWVGNNDNTEMGHVSGITGAAPIWHNFMLAAHDSRPVRDFARPDDVIETEVCADSGTRPSEKCPNRRSGLFLKDSPPPPAQLDYWRKVKIDTFTGLLTNEFCPGSSEEQWFFVLPEEQPVRDWVNNTAAGQEWAHARNLIPLPEWAALPPDQQAEARASGRIPVLDPPREFCNEQTTRPEVVITSPVEGQEIAGPIELIGTVKAPDFAYYVIEYGVSWNPGAWGEVQGPAYTQVENGPLGTWNPAAFDRDTGDFSLRVIVYNTKGGKAESTPVHVRLVQPTPTPTLTPMPTATDTPVPTATPTSTPGPTDTPTPTWTPFVPPTPTDTPAPPTPTGTPEPPTEPPPTPTNTPPPGSEPTQPPK